MTGFRRPIALLMTLEALSLAVVSTVHLSLSDRSAGIPEAVICVVVATGAAAVWRSSPRWRAIALGTIGFAIAGFALGLSITIGGPSVGDVVYHATVLPILIVTFVLALRERGGESVTVASGPGSAPKHMPIAERETFRAE